MKKLKLIGIIVVLLLVGIAPVTSNAQSATNQLWSTAITYYTPSDTGGTLTISYYAEGSATPIDAAPITLAPHKAGSLYIGAVSGIGSTFSGSAVLSSDVPIVATAVNIAGSDYPRPLYSGFDPSQASGEFFVPTVLYRAFGSSSLVGIQNVESSAIQATLRIYALGSTSPSFEKQYTIQGQSSVLVSASDMNLTAGFSGSGTVTVDGAGKVVVAVQETDDSGRGAKAFVGVASTAGAEQLYMPSMLCRAFGGQISYYAIQNVGTGQAQVEIDFYGKDGLLKHTATGITINEGNKVSTNPCMYVGAAPALEEINGSAVIRSTNGVNLIAMGKVTGAGMTTTAFLGEAAGNMAIAAPYIRWKAVASAGERSYVAVMNVGSGDATNVTATYYDNQGNVAGTHTLASSGIPLGRFIKVNSNASTGGALDGNGDFGVPPPGYGGAIEIESDQPLVVVVRVAKTVSLGDVTMLADDYNGIAVP